VQLISAAEIDTGGFTNFAELANGLIRGANVGYSPDEGEFTIRIDGGSDRDTLLLLDGVPTFDRGTPLEDIWGADVDGSAHDPDRGDPARRHRASITAATAASAWCPCEYKEPGGRSARRVRRVLRARSRPARSTAT
jgi:hypothetical protein